MILSSLELTDFQSYPGAKISFSNERLTFITGMDMDTHSSNGVGKSSIKEAILFALFGRGKVKATDLIRRGAKQAKVTLALEHNGQSIVITRVRKQTSAALHLTINGVEQKGTLETLQKQIETTLGTNQDLITTYSIIDKVRDSDLTKLSSADLRLVLQDLVGMDRLQTVITRLIELRNDANRFLSRATTRFFPSTKRLEVFTGFFDLLRSKQSETTHKLISLASEQSSLQGQIQDIDSKLLELQGLEKKTIETTVCPECGAAIATTKRLATLNTIGETRAALAVSRADLVAKRDKAGEELTTLKSASTWVNERLVKLSYRRGQLEEAIKSQVDINKVLQESQLYATAITCVQDYITQALRGIAAQVEDHMNAELTRFTNLACKVNLTKVGGSGEEMPACYLSLIRDGHEYTNEMLSSGELALLSIVFKLVLSDLKGGIDLLFVDEGLDALDETNRERVLSLLETSNHQQVFIISHREDAGHLKSAQKIILRKAAGETQVI